MSQSESEPAPAGRARVYVRHSGAHHAGHVGWGYLLPDGSWEVGAVERGGIITPPLKDGFWRGEFVDPTPRMRELRYDAYKEFDVGAPNPEAARAQEDVIDKRYFSLARHNCMNDTHDVLTAYGAKLPNPDRFWDWRPNEWFREIEGELIPLAPAMAAE